ncbi:hypothetical protein DLAC_04888 [Tieghemostelium lacteum]|uniref:Uncharacterized protein n=1 Tax=Tieghemostelium lacteum TaxID=361077 RepID=A0A151ZJ40_TIELA|nr:hypothetical protein DLAC_04888 [Tieghemostelium lacteum]|eukprot:KYQ93993.1 hypothetical protein DLAC_04888 [Tieghemostelium lacteum]
MEVKDITVPGYFPAVTNECKESAAKFFMCIEKSLTYFNEDDKEGPKRGLTMCEKQLVEYTKCMNVSLSKGNERIL